MNPWIIFSILSVLLLVGRIEWSRREIQSLSVKRVELDTLACTYLGDAKRLQTELDAAKAEVVFLTTKADDLQAENELWRTNPSAAWDKFGPRMSLTAVKEASEAKPLRSRRTYGQVQADYERAHSRAQRNAEVIENAQKSQQ